MPHTSMKTKVLQELQTVFRRRTVARAIRTFDSDSDSYEDAVDEALFASITNSHRRRYFSRFKSRKGASNRIFEVDLDAGDDDTDDEDAGNEDTDDEDQPPWLSDDEFLRKYRMSRKNFEAVVEKIKDHEVFNSQVKRRKQKPPSYQLLVFLKYVGTEGSGASNANQRCTFGIGYGTAALYRDRVTKALRSLSQEYIQWPDEEERLIISKEMQKMYHFPHCVSIVDGTLFPLAFEPYTKDAPDYSGRKYGYSLSTLILCDHKRRIRHYLAGFPGSVHDNRIWKASKMYADPKSYFSDREYCIGDSAFANSSFMVSAFKKPKGLAIPVQHVKFNEKLASMRIISEHCIGMLKGRFPWLRSIRLTLTENKRSLTKILLLLEATIVLHNMLIEFGEQERDEWIDRDDFSDFDDAERAPHLPGDALYEPIPVGARNDEKRTRLMHFLQEHFIF